MAASKIGTDTFCRADVGPGDKAKKFVSDLLAEYPQVRVTGPKGLECG